MRRRSNWLTAILTVVLAISVGCGTSSGGGGSSAAGGSGGKGAAGDESVVTTVDGLIRVDSAARGDLFLRKDHGIGGYDAIAIAPSFLNYRRTSARLAPDDEEVYQVSLEQALVDVAEAAGAPIVYEAGECVIKVGAGFINVDLARTASSKMLGRMTLVIDYKDSMSGQSLLRYVAEQSVQRESGDISREKQIGDSFDRMIEEVNIIAILRAATIVPSKPRAGCSGALMGAGRRPQSDSD